MSKLKKNILLIVLSIIFVVTACVFLGCKDKRELNISVADSVNVRADDSLYSVKQYLTVTYTDQKGNVSTVTDYTIKGKLAAGQTTLSVEYAGLSADFVVNVQSPVKYYSVFFKTDDGQNISIVPSVAANSAITAPASPQKDGYKFVGWGKDLISAQLWDFASDKVTSNVTLYAKWVALYSVSFNSNGGSSVATKYNVESNNTVTEPTAPQKDGYKFVGWYKDLNDSTAWDFAADTVTTDTVLHAKWVKLVTVTFNSNGGGAVDAIRNIDVNSTVAEPASPQKDGYKFLGWYADWDCNTAWNFADDKVTRDCTLYAKWVKVVAEINSLVLHLNDDDASYTVTGLTSEGSAATFVTIPLSYEGLPVNAIGEKAFHDCPALETFTFFSNVKSIGKNAFLGCGTIQEVNYEGSLTDWCAIDFANIWANPTVVTDKLYVSNSLIIGLDLPDDVTEIKQFAFSHTLCLTSVRFPDSVTAIDDYAFSECTNLKSISFGSNLRSIGSFSFAFCHSLTSVTIPDSVQSFDVGIFYNCQRLQQAVISEGVTTLGDAMFASCDKLSDVSLPNSLESVGNHVFLGCTKLRALDYRSEKYLGNYQNPYLYLIAVKNKAYYFEYSVNSRTRFIGEEAVTDCSNLTALYIPASVLQIKPDAVNECPNLSTIEVDEDNPRYYSRGNCVIDSVTKTLILGCKDSTMPTDDSVIAIDDGAFVG